MPVSDETGLHAIEQPCPTTHCPSDSALCRTLALRTLDGVDGDREPRSRPVGRVPSGCKQAPAAELRDDHRVDRTRSSARVDPAAAEAGAGHREQRGGHSRVGRRLAELASRGRRRGRTGSAADDRDRHERVRDRVVHRCGDGSGAARRLDDGTRRAHRFVHPLGSHVHRIGGGRDRLAARWQRRSRNSVVRVRNRTSRSAVHDLLAVAAQYENRCTRQCDRRACFDGGGVRRHSVWRRGIEHRNESCCCPVGARQRDFGRTT